MGERKPKPGPFQEAVKRAGYASVNAVGGEWVHVGDDWESDCVGGKVTSGCWQRVFVRSQNIKCQQGIGAVLAFVFHLWIARAFWAGQSSLPAQLGNLLAQPEHLSLRAAYSVRAASAGKDWMA